MFEGLIASISAMVVVIVILYLTYISSKYIGKMGKIRGASKHIKFIDQVIVGQDRSIAIIKVDENYLLVGITSDNINILKELPDFDENKENLEVNKEEVLDFGAIMNKIVKKGRDK